MHSSHARGCESYPINLINTQGYLSFWNDNISYALRGCILIELALRRRIVVHKDPNRRRIPAAERLVEVIDTRQTGETILDETLKMMKAQESERMSINAWIDLLSGACFPLNCLNESGNPTHAASPHRRDLECAQDRLSAEASPRTPCQGSR